MRDSRERLIVALDVSSAAAAQKIVAAVGDSARIYKVGMQSYTAEGPSVVRDLIASGRQVFLDLKYHDIPNTVGCAVMEAAKLGVRMGLGIADCLRHLRLETRCWATTLSSCRQRCESPAGIFVRRFEVRIR